MASRNLRLRAGSASQCDTHCSHTDTQRLGIYASELALRVPPHGPEPGPVCVSQSTPPSWLCEVLSEMDVRDALLIRSRNLRLRAGSASGLRRFRDVASVVVSESTPPSWLCELMCMHRVEVVNESRNLRLRAGCARSTTDRAAAGPSGSRNLRLRAGSASFDPAPDERKSGSSRNLRLRAGSASSPAAREGPVGNESRNLRLRAGSASRSAALRAGERRHVSESTPPSWLCESSRRSAELSRT